MKRKIKIISISISIFVALIFLFGYFVFKPSIIQSSRSIGNLSTKLIYDEELKQELFVLSGNVIDSALWIYSYNIKYGNEKVFIEIKRSLGKTGNSSFYYVKFILPKEVNKVYLGETEVLWTR